MSERVIIHQNGQQKSINKEDFDLSLGKLDKGYTLSQLRNLSEKVLLATIHFLCTEEGKDGFWDVDETDDTSVDNVGTCIVSVDGVRIKRRVQDKILFSWFEDNTNDSNALQKALLVASDLEKPLFLIPYSTITINQSFNVSSSIIGDNSTIKLIDASTVAYQSGILEVKADNVKIRGISIDGNRANNLGLFDRGVRGIVANRVKNLELDEIKVINTRDIGVLIGNCPKFKFTRSIVDGCGRYGQQMATAQFDRIGVLLDNHYPIGHEFYMGSDTVVKDVDITSCGLDGLVLGVGGIYENIRANYNGLELTTANDGAAGIYIRPPQQYQDGIIDGLKIINCETNYNTGIGIDLGNNAYSILNPRVTNFMIIGNTARGNWLHGIGVASAENGLISRNLCFDNGTRATFTDGSQNLRRAGIGIACVPNIPFKNLTVENNICYDSKAVGQKTQLNGLWFSTDTKDFLSETLIVKNNDFSRNAGKAIQFADKSPVLATTVLSITNNHGVNSFTIGIGNNQKIQPVNEHIYVNAANALSIGGIDLSTLNNVVTLENVCPYDLTLIHGVFFKMLGQENLVLKPNKPVHFVQNFETGSFVWRQLPTKTADVFYNGQITIQNQGVVTNDPASRFSVKSTTQGAKPYPEMTQAQRLAIVLPTTNLHVYQTDGGVGVEGVWCYKSTGWSYCY